MVQFLKSGGVETPDPAYTDASMVIHKTPALWSSSYMFSTMKTHDDYIYTNADVNIVIVTSQRNGILLDGSPISITWKRIGIPLMISMDR